jgi:hypothetical protein
MSQGIKTLLWAGVVGGLVAYAYFGVHKGDEKKAEAEAKDKTVATWEQKDIEQLSVIKGATRVRLERAEPFDEAKTSVWRVVEPYSDLADTTSVSQLIASILSEKTTQLVKELSGEAEQQDLTAFGLQEPAGQVVIEGKGRKQTISLGSVKAYDGSVYLRRDNEPQVWLASSSWDGHVGKAPNDFRDKRIWRIDETPTVSSLSLSGAGVRTELARQDGIWRAKGGGDPFEISASQIQQYISSVRALRVASWPENGVKRGREIVRLRLTDDKGQEFSLAAFAQTGAGEGQVLVESSDLKLAGLAFQSSVDELIKQTPDFFDRRIPFQFDAGAVQSFTISASRPSAVRFGAERKGQGDKNWALAEKPATEPKGLQLNSEGVEDLLGKLSRLEAEKILSPLRPGTQSPFQEVGSLTLKLGEKTIGFSWSDLKTDHHLVRSTLSPRLVRVSKVSWETLPFATWVTLPSAGDSGAGAVKNEN